MKKITACLIVLTLILSGCSTHRESHTDSSSATSQNDSGQSQSQGAQTPGQSLPDPRTLTGLSEVSQIGDPRIIGDYPQQLPVTVTDHENNRVTVTDTSRILALDLTGTLSRTVVALGLGDRIVGRTISSTESVLADLPVVTQDGHSLNAEAIISLHPTLILADRSVGPPETIDQLKAVGIPVVLFDPDHTIDKVAADIQSVAGALGMPQAGEALAQRATQEIADAQTQIASWAPKEPLDAAFLYVRGTAGIFFILGSENGAASLIKAVGARDVAAEHGIATTIPANAESLLTLNPEIIITMTNGLESTDGMAGLLARPGVADTRAGKKQRVVAIPDGLSLAFGPQTGEILLAIARAMYGVEGDS